MNLVVDARGVVRLVYAETFDWRGFGVLSIDRASHVEPDLRGLWFADLAPVGGPRLGPFHVRSEALAAEQAWLDQHILND